MVDTLDYKELRASISKYIEQYPTPTRKDNDRRLKELRKLEATSPSSPKIKKIRDYIVLSNGGLAMRYVTRYMKMLNDDVSVMDLFQEANMGLLEAIDTFDLSLKTSFTTYAPYHIRKRVIDFIKKNKLVRAPRDIARNMRHVSIVKDELYTQTMGEPTREEIQERLKEKFGTDVSLKRIDEVLILLELSSAGSAETFLSEFKEQVVDENEGTLFKRMEANILNNLRDYKKGFQQAVILRFGIGEEYPHTLEEIRYMIGYGECDNK